MSKKTLQRVFLDVSDNLKEQLSEQLIPQLREFSTLIDLRFYKSWSVHLSRLSESPADIHEQVSLLRIPWTAILPGSLQFQMEICQNLSSLALKESRSHWDWRKILSRPAQNLKHLSLRLKGSSEGLAPLQFSQMEELEITEDRFGIELLGSRDLNRLTGGWVSSLLSASNSSWMPFLFAHSLTLHNSSLSSLFILLGSPPQRSESSPRMSCGESQTCSSWKFTWTERDWWEDESGKKSNNICVD